MRKDNLPIIDIDKLLALKKCPPLITVDIDRNEFIKYAIYRYVNQGVSINSITKDIKVKSYVHVIRWLQKYGVHEKADYDRKKYSGKIPFKRTPEFCRKAKELFDSGIKTYEGIAKELNCNASTISLIAKEKGWAPSLNRREFVWEIPNKLPVNDIDDYKLYKRTIYHFTKKIGSKYFTAKQKNQLKSGKFDIDHILSIYEAFNRGVNPLPWQIVCHPANLQIITTADNLVKGKASDLNPKELFVKVKNFEKEFGKVPLPLHKVPIPLYLGRK